MEMMVMIMVMIMVIIMMVKVLENVRKSRRSEIIIVNHIGRELKMRAQ